MDKAFRNRRVPGTELIYMGTLEHQQVGRRLDIFTSPDDLGVLGIGEAIRNTGQLIGWHGFNGLRPSPSAYEHGVFSAWKEGCGLKQWVLMPLIVLYGIDYPESSRWFRELGGRVFEPRAFDGNLFGNMNEGDLRGTFRLGVSEVSVYGSCTKGPGSELSTGRIDFRTGKDYWERNIVEPIPFNVRPCLACEVTHDLPAP